MPSNSVSMDPRLTLIRLVRLNSLNVIYFSSNQNQISILRLQNKLCLILDRNKGRSRFNLNSPSIHRCGELLLCLLFYSPSIPLASYFVPTINLPFVHPFGEVFCVDYLTLPPNIGMASNILL